MSGADPATARAAVLAERLAAVRTRITEACAAAGRRTQPELIVVTKFFPASDVRALYELGVRDVGENRDQEAAAKAVETADLPLNWHFIGQLQKNKAKSVIRYAAAVHSVDREQLITALANAVAADAARRAGAGEPPRAPLGCFLQVDLDSPAAGTSGRGGAAPADVPGLAAAVDAAEGLELKGVMAVAPLCGDPHEAFARLALISERVRAAHPSAAAVSAGMSGDLEAAIAAGATHLRIGSDVLGPRPALR